jgi:hypothetical protein
MIERKRAALRSVQEKSVSVLLWARCRMSRRGGQVDDVRGRFLDLLSSAGATKGAHGGWVEQKRALEQRQRWLRWGAGSMARRVRWSWFLWLSELEIKMARIGWPVREAFTIPAASG